MIQKTYRDFPKQENWIKNTMAKLLNKRGVKKPRQVYQRKTQFFGWINALKK